MTETQLTSQLVKKLQERLPRSVVFKIADRFTIGLPDIACTWRGRTSWIEAKLETDGRKEGFKSPGIQNLTANRLHDAGHCFYVIYSLKRHHTRLVWPKDVRTENYFKVAGGIDHQVVVEYLIESSDLSKIELEPR